MKRGKGSQRLPPGLQGPFKQDFKHFTHVNSSTFNVFNCDKDKSFLKAVMTNCDSLLNKRDELSVLICQHEPKIILLTEILPKNVKNPIDRSELVIPNYELYVSSLVKGRGVATYIHESISSIVVENLAIELFQESVWCCCKLDNNDKLLIGNIYRSPNSSPENNKNLNTLLKSVMQAAYSHILIAGDFNYKDIDWLTIESTVDIENDTSIFLENIRDLYLTQYVTKPPTRFRENQNDSCLDLIFTNEELMIDSPRVFT